MSKVALCRYRYCTSTWCRSNGSTRAMRIANEVTRYDSIILVKEKYVATVLIVVAKSSESICTVRLLLSKYFGFGK